VAVRREQVVGVLRAALLPLPYVNAAWLGGSDAFGRSDELSDVDLQVDVDDGRVAATFGAVEAALAAASPILYRMVMPMPTWHGHAQRFYRLRDTADQAELAATLAAAVASIAERLPFTLPLVAKEVRRGDALAALGSYQRHVVAPLVMLYRMRHTPARHDFGSRYTRDDLPAEVQETLRELSFVADLDDLAARLPRAERLLRELLDELG
jgi:hypothetical protein